LAQLGTVAIVGFGLIGGSVALALRERSLAGRVIGISRSERALAEAARIGAIHAYSTNLALGVAGVDLVVVCTPVTDIARSVVVVARHATSGVLVTDAGSTKRAIVEAVERDDRGRSVFVGAHPIAGSDRKGPAYADPDLFEGRVCVLTPTEQTPADRLERARVFWEMLGCRVVELDPVGHDEALALTSHLPHALAAALAATVPPEVLDLAAGAYHDGTRVARSDAALWSGIFRQNRGPLLRALTRLEVELHTFRHALVDDDDAALQEWWTAARDNRTQFDERFAKSAEEDED
jgi:prephenate dehydrogenase